MSIVLTNFSFDVIHIFVLSFVNQYCLRMGFLRTSKLFRTISVSVRNESPCPQIAQNHSV